MFEVLVYVSWGVDLFCLKGVMLVLFLSILDVLLLGLRGRLGGVIFTKSLPWYVWVGKGGGGRLREGDVNGCGSLVIGANLFTFARVTAGLVAFFLIPLCATCVSATSFNIASVDSAIIDVILPLTALSISSNMLHFTVSSGAGHSHCVDLNLIIILFDVVIITILSPVLDLSFFKNLSQCHKLFVTSCTLYTLRAFFGVLTHTLGGMEVVPVSTVIAATLATVYTIMFVTRVNLKTSNFFCSLLINGVNNILYFFFIKNVFQRFGLRFRAGSVTVLGQVLVCYVPVIPGTLF